MQLDRRDVLGLPRTAPRQFPGPQPARVRRAGPAGLYVELDAQPGVEVGPCSWGRPLPQTTNHAHGATSTVTLTYDNGFPPGGTRCLVVFTDAGLADPWVTAFDGWPA